MPFPWDVTGPLQWDRAVAVSTGRRIGRTMGRPVDVSMRGALAAPRDRAVAVSMGGALAEPWDIAMDVSMDVLLCRLSGNAGMHKHYCGGMGGC